MKISLVAMATIAVLASGVTARAGEGNGPDFPGLLRPHTTLANPVLSGTGSDAYPGVVGTKLNPFVAAGVLPSNGSEGVVQTENSLPRDFARQTPAYEHAQSVQRYWAQRQGTNLALGVVGPLKGNSR